MSEELPSKEWSEIIKCISDGMPLTVEKTLIEIPQTLQHGCIAREFNLINCIVRGAFTANRVVFAESVSFFGTTFENGLNLDGCTINGNFDARGVVIKEKASFEGLTVAQQAYFDGCTFGVSPNFALAHFGTFTSFDKVVFAVGGTFIGATSNGYLALNNLPDCRGTVDFSLASIGGPLYLNKSKFLGSLIGNALNVRGPVLLTDTEFGPDATLSLFRATVEGLLKLEGCTFNNEGAVCLDLRGIAVGGGCEMNHVICLGGFRMDDARVSRFLWIGEEDEQQIRSQTQHYAFFARGFSLSSLRLDGALTCAGVAFSPPPRDGAETPIAPDDKLAPPDFSGMRIDDRVFIMGCKFPRGANFNRADIGGAFGLIAQSKRSVSFECTRFQKAARFLSGCVFEKGVEFCFAQFDDEANFGGARIAGRLNLSNARLNDSLLFDHKGDIVQFEDTNDSLVQVLLHDCTCRRLILPNKYAGLQLFLARMPSEDTSSFISFEQCLRQSGHRQLADQIRIHWNECERAQMTVLGLRWFWRSAHKVLTRYGTTPAILIILAIALGLANVAGPYIHKPQSWNWLMTFQFISGTLGTFFLALGADALRRRVWSE